jgi:hypothetical protein
MPDSNATFTPRSSVSVSGAPTLLEPSADLTPAPYPLPSHVHDLITTTFLVCVGFSVSIAVKALSVSSLLKSFISSKPAPEAITIPTVIMLLVDMLGMVGFYDTYPKTHPVHHAVGILGATVCGTAGLHVGILLFGIRRRWIGF